MKIQKFIPLTKMEEQADGTLHVFGTVTAEEPDLSNEVCDYAGTKPYYQAKVEKMFKLTSAVEGVTPSIMPMREMHQLITIGAGRTIEFDDAAKTIRMGFEVVDPVAITKFKKGALIGFSQGGEYVRLWDDPVHKGCKRYIADPAEVSGVDAPCLTSALVDTMKGHTVTLQKLSGATEEIALQVPDRMDRIEQALEALLKRETVLPANPVEGKAATGGEEKHMEKTAEELELAKKAAIEKMKSARKAHNAMAECLGGYCDHDGAEKCAEKCEEASGIIKAAFEDGDGKGKKSEKVAKADNSALEAKVDTLTSALGELAKSQKELTEKLSKTAAPIAVHTGVTDPLAKAAPGVPAGFEDLIQAPAVAH